MAIGYNEAVKKEYSTSINNSEFAMIDKIKQMIKQQSPGLSEAQVTQLARKFRQEGRQPNRYSIEEFLKKEA
jgi:hypothetical protein